MNVGRKGDLELLTEAIALFGDQSDEEKARIARQLRATADAYNQHAARLAGTPSVATVSAELKELADTAERLAGMMRRLSQRGREAIGGGYFGIGPRTDEEALEQEVIELCDFPESSTERSDGNLHDIVLALARIMRKADRWLSHDRPNSKAFLDTDWAIPNAKRALTVSCGQMLFEAGVRLSGTRGNSLHKLTSIIYEFASGSNPEGKGSGLEDSVITVGRCYRELRELYDRVASVVKEGHPVPLRGPGSELYTEEDRIRREIGYGLPLGRISDCESPVTEVWVNQDEECDEAVESPPANS